MSQRIEPLPLILVVDDAPTSLQCLTAALKSDYRIGTATNGAAGLERVYREDPPDLILLDILMPEMTGIEMLERLRADPATRSIPVILVSSDASEQTQIEGLGLGADDYLTKPVAPNVLRAKIRNLLERKRCEMDLSLAAQVFEQSGDAILVTDADHRIIRVNPAFSRLTGYSAEEALGRNPRFLSAGHTPPEVYQDMWRALLSTGSWRGELWDRHRDGTVYPKLLTITAVRDVHGRIARCIGIFRDISEQKAAEDRIRHTAHHDPLTGLPNRRYLEIALEQMLSIAERAGQEVAVMFIDLDRFKHINDTYGHAVGDHLLIEVARRLSGCLRESDLAARLGGDEFVVVMTGSGIAAAACGIAEKICEELSRVYPVNGQMLETSPSIGISLCYPQDGKTGESMIAQADAAMYRVKARGRRGIQFHDTPRVAHRADFSE